MITIYIYRKSDGMFLYQDQGNPNNVIDDLGEDKDFTTTPLPDHEHVWYWIDNKWIKKP